MEGFRIEHCELISDFDLSRLIDLSGRASFQTNFGQDDYDYESILGPIVKECNPLRKAINAGLQFGLGSDGMPSGYPECLVWAVRPRRNAQTLTLEEAVYYATVGSSGLVGKRGGLDIGCPANFVLFEKPINVLETWERPIETNWTTLRGQLDQVLPLIATYIRGKQVWPK